MQTATEKQSIEERAREHLYSRAEDIKSIMQRQQSEDPEIADQAYEDFYQYGLGFDYVDPFTFDDQRAGYWRWQISWGGPSEEFRIYVNQDEEVKAIDFTFLDWGEGHTITLNPNHYDAIFNAADQLMEGR